jgi:spore coat protein A
VKEAFAEMIPGIRTPVLGYDGMVPGPTFKVRIGQPIVVRQFNDLVDTELSTHLHGGHNPAHSDGFPNFYILPGKSRDYFYTNTVPLLNGKADFSESPSTCWYHDHAMDISGDTLIHGLCGFYLQCDDLELSLIAGNVLPGDPFDIPVMIQDRSFNADGTIFYDPLDHNGYLGDVYCVNGKAFPKLHVQRRKYRFRFLNGCYARHLELRLSDSRSFLGSATVAAGTPLRPHVPVRPEEIIETRVFEFTRRNGAWQINQRFFDEFRADACPRLGSAERWILRNGSGGWWHPVHIQLESLLHEM